MKVSEAIEVLKTGAEVARKAGVTRQAVWNWKDKDDLIPELYARRLHESTKGRLRFDMAEYLEQ